jgi:hypothetical protein
VVFLFSLLVPLAPAQAFDVDTHYVWTYYLALHVGYTPRQAFQIASAAFAIDHDPNTSPMKAGPGDAILGAENIGNLRLLDIWRRFHCFGERRLTRENSSPTPDEIAYMGLQAAVLVTRLSQGDVSALLEPFRNDDLREARGWLTNPGGDVDAARTANAAALFRLAMREHNPGPYVHFMQDFTSHFEFSDLRGHALAGHAPDFLSFDRFRSWGMTLATIQALRRFMSEDATFGSVPGRPRPTPRRPDYKRLGDVLNQLVKVSPVPPVNLSGTQDPGPQGNLLAAILNFHPSAEGPPGNVDRREAWRAVNRAIDEDRASGLIYAFPDRFFDNAEQELPYDWHQYGYNSDGNVTSAPGRFAVEQPAVSIGAFTPAFARVPGSPNNAYVVTLRAAYTIQGLADIPLLSPLPVLEDASVSDFGASARGRQRRTNGTYTIERTVQRSLADLRSGTLSWTVTVTAYGLEPVSQTFVVPAPSDAGRADQPPAVPTPPAGPTFDGDWICPIRGAMTLTVSGTSLSGTFTGKPGEHWGSGQRAGGTMKGTVTGNRMNVLQDSGDGTVSDLTATLAADGRTLSGTYIWRRGTARLGTGTWDCHR